MRDVNFVLSIYFALILNNVYGSMQPEVKIRQGIVLGKFETTFKGRQIISFNGIPYAKPPTGKHRFKEAIPSSSWIGKYQAIRKPSDCLQYDHFHYNSEFAVHGSEDCLYINVYTPKLPNKGVHRDNLMDVIVYIHGGAFMFSAGYYYRPEVLLDRDIVFVTFNYRLGPLGFMSTEDDLIPGNNGLKDQVLALKWVKDNIAAFGGNPESVTIAGMSAGGSSVHYHMLSPLSKGLFKKAISASGTSFCPWSQADNSREKTHIIAQGLGCPTNDSTMLDCLRQRPGKDIVELSKSFMTLKYNPFSPFGPVIEKSGPKSFIDKQPIDLIKEGLINDVPWLVSFTANEGLYPGAEIICDGTSFDSLINEWNNLAHHILDFSYTTENFDDVNKAVLSEYSNGKSVLGKEDFIKMLGDRLFLADIVYSAKLQASISNSSIYSYKFSYRGDKSVSDYFCADKTNYGVSHADDMVYIVYLELLQNNTSERDRRMMDYMADLWISFAASGIPSFGRSGQIWPEIKQNLPEFTFLDIKSPDLVEVIKTEELGNWNFWNSLKLKENIPKSFSPTRDEL